MSVGNSPHALECPKCGAPLKATEGMHVITCHFCATTVPIPGANAPPAHPHRQPQLPPQMAELARMLVEQQRTPSRIVAQVPTARAARTGGGIVLFVILMTALPGIIGGIAAYRAATAGKPGIFAQVSDVVSGLTKPQWVESGPTPIVVDVDGDGDDEVIGPISEYAKGQSSEYIAGFDVGQKKERWRFPIGNLSEVKMALSGNRLVIVDKDGGAHVLDAATGKVAGSVSLSDKARLACGDESKGGVAFFVLSDDKIVSVDGKSMTASNAPWPSRCGTPKWRPGACAQDHGAICSSDSGSAPKLDHYYVDHTLVEGSLGVGLARKSPGTPRPLFFGFDPTTKAVSWQVDVGGPSHRARDGVPAAADVVDGHLYAVYSTATGANQATFLGSWDASTGKLRWESQLTTSSPGWDAKSILVKNGRIYVTYQGALIIFAVKDGAVVERIGKS